MLDLRRKYETYHYENMFNSNNNARMERRRQYNEYKQLSAE
jgi:hypothetical protein